MGLPTAGDPNTAKMQSNNDACLRVTNALDCWCSVFCLLSACPPEGCEQATGAVQGLDSKLHRWTDALAVQGVHSQECW